MNGPSSTARKPVRRLAVLSRKGENFYTLLFREGEGFRRQDLSEEAWQQRNDNLRPFSFWRSPLNRAGRAAGDVAEGKRGRAFPPSGRGGRRANANACYVLAAMLERKKILKPIKVKMANGKVLIYEHAKTGDVFVVPDPQLHLDELEPVQTEVASFCRAAALA